MSGRARHLVAAAVFLLLLTRPAFGYIWIIDYVEAGLLNDIQVFLAAIEKYRMIVQDLNQRKIENRFGTYIFPEAAFQEVRMITTEVADIRRELNRLACVWPTSRRTGPLEDLLLQRLTWCKDDYRRTWGSHQGMWDAQLQEAHDYVGTMTANMISERTEKTNTAWASASRDLYVDAASNLKAPGEANRLEAASLALTNQIALGNAQITTQNLLVRQMARDLERYDQKKADDTAYYLYRGVTTLAGRDWKSAPPDPADLQP
jgi:hypothetical protein